SIMISEVHSQASITCGCSACAASTTTHHPKPFSRRRFMAGTVTAALLPAAINLATAGKALAQSTMSPDQALQELVDGNKRYVEGRMTAFEQDLAILKQKNAEKQEPFAAVLSCADSRVPVELVFDQSIGHLF